MPAPASRDKRYLQAHGAKFKVVVPVPRKLQGQFGKTKLIAMLDTDSLEEANRLKWPIVARFHDLLNSSRTPKKVGAIIDVPNAVEYRNALIRAVDEDHRESILDHVVAVAEDMLGAPVEAVGRGHYVYERERENAADAFFKVATGEHTPLDYHRSMYLSQLHVKKRTLADDERAFSYFVSWCAKNNVSQVLEAVQRAHAVAFVDELPKILGTNQPNTINKYVSRLSTFWKWMASRDYVTKNIWENRKVQARHTTEDDAERPFNKDEVARLLTGEAPKWLHDVMRIGALTGARLDAIISLRVGDCDGATFKFKPQKKEKNYRYCPVHSSLAEIVTRRTHGFAADAPLFPECPMSTSELKEISGPASSAFTRYRRKVGVEDPRRDNRRERVNFHSFRRWFITEAERAGQSGDIIAAVVGHKRSGMTLGLYSAGPSMDQARVCVEAVKLPVE